MQNHFQLLELTATDDHHRQTDETIASNTAKMVCISSYPLQIRSEASERGINGPTWGINGTRHHRPPSTFSIFFLNTRRRARPTFASPPLREHTGNPRWLQGPGLDANIMTGLAGYLLQMDEC